MAAFVMTGVEPSSCATAVLIQNKCLYQGIINLLDKSGFKKLPLVGGRQVITLAPQRIRF